MRDEIKLHKQWMKTLEAEVQSFFDKIKEYPYQRIHDRKDEDRQKEPFCTFAIADMLGLLLPHCIHTTEGWDHGSELAVQWGLEKMWAKEVGRVLPLYHEIHSWLLDNGRTKDNPVVWNDLDYKAYVIPHDKYKMVVYSSQGRDTFYKLDPSGVSEPGWDDVCTFSAYWVDPEGWSFEHSEYMVAEWKAIKADNWKGEHSWKGQIFQYDNWSPNNQFAKVQHVMNHGGDIAHNLWVIRMIHNVLMSNDFDDD
jgi:hypothetical protein